MPLTDKEMIRILKKEGWTVGTKKGKGSHTRMFKSGYRPITIPHGELAKGTEHSIKKQAGLK